ncbi:type IV conjugative transfer system protein TraE [Serratia proteamaculans]|uniref:type IV conjugative transfer system protein TraE n=1 Tax=Serratia proteamaculans TaxID=28151 RepID=UPI0039BE090D
MKFNIKQANDKLIAISFIFVVVLLAVSLVSNIIVGKMAWYFYTTQRTQTVPMIFNKPFTTTMNATDWNYIEMATLSFISLRLNVTPENVEAQHAVLLSFTPSEQRPALKKMLDVEAEYIKSNGVSTVFYMEKILTEPNTGDILITGLLKSNTTNGPLADTLKAYRLILPYVNGRSIIREFNEIPYKSVTQVAPNSGAN